MIAAPLIVVSAGMIHNDPAAIVIDVPMFMIATPITIPIRRQAYCGRHNRHRGHKRQSRNSKSF